MNRVGSTLPFAPSRAMLDAVIRFFAEQGEYAGGAVEATVRRAAFARYQRGVGELKLPYQSVRWTSGCMTLPTSPIVPLPSDEEVSVDRPALATENAGGLAHLGATCLQGPASRGNDARIIVLPLGQARRKYSDLLVQMQHQIVRARGGRFAALATAFQNCGAFVFVPPGVVLEAPIQLVWSYSDARVETVFPQIVVLLGEGARATVIERHVGEGDAFVCGIVEVKAEAGAQLDYVAIQQNGDGALVRMTRVAHCERNARVNWHLADLGAASARTLLDVRLDAPGACAQTAALFFNTGTQQVELTTLTDHRAARSNSKTVVRGAAGDRGRGRYVGLLRVHAQSSGCSASLRADALLLSKHARLVAKPELEIRAHDVAASHGATVGSLDEDALFYVQSRGLAHAEAVRMITLAFFEPAVACFPSAMLQDEIRTALDRKIDERTEPL